MTEIQTHNLACPKPSILSTKLGHLIYYINDSWYLIHPKMCKELNLVDFCLWPRKGKSILKYGTVLSIEKSCCVCNVSNFNLLHKHSGFVFQENCEVLWVSEMQLVVKTNLCFVVLDRKKEQTADASKTNNHNAKPTLWKSDYVCNFSGPLEVLHQAECGFNLAEN